MSFAMTPDAIRDRSKTVTRRLGWTFLTVGDRLQAVDRSPRAGDFERLAVLEVVDICLEPLAAVLDEPNGCAREGLPDLTPVEFARRFTSSMHCSLDTIVTRIEFRYVEAEG
jgi:hypothetical protein